MDSSPILFQNDSGTTVLLDLPRSIEEAQLPSHDHDAAKTPKLKRLVSAPPPKCPFPTPEPKSTSDPHGYPSASAQVAEMMTLAAMESALDEIRMSPYAGPWCLPRHSRPPPASSHELRAPPVEDHDDPSQYTIPPSSHPVHGSIASTRATILSTAPKFNLIVLDPPWPNRSAKRKRGGGSYRQADGLPATRSLLSLIPVASHLAADGLVAIWVTNAARFADLLTAPRGGVFAEWQVELVGEWTWLKLAANGEPIVSLHSAWRKPWERLLIARRRGGGGGGLAKLLPERKVIVTVPDVHSRKPNLRCLFEEYLPPQYQALEVFARSLTAGWWSWGDQVLLFQHRDHWID
ncbi:MT-A70-domain-containing protein, partial [Podospora appendiculata]